MKPIIGVSTHARERAVERLGRDPTRDEWLTAVLACIDQTAPLLARQRQNELRVVTLCGIEVRAWWSPDTAMIVTVLELSGGYASPELTRRIEQRSILRQRRLTEPYRRARKDWRADV